MNIVNPEGEPYFTMEDLADIDFAAAGIKDPVQCVYRLLLTPKYSVPLERTMGMENEVVDAPINEAPDLLIAEILEVVHLWEPRVEILEVTFLADGQAGKLIPRIRLAVHNVISGSRDSYSNYPSYEW
jgi:phage baseplate assembly protein W